WFVSHVHIDHMVSLPQYVARRRMMKMDPTVVYAPAYAIDDLRRLLLVVQRLDRCRMLCDLRGMEAGQEITLSRDHVITTLATSHTIPSLGFVVWERKMKLKEEFLGLPGPQIRDLKFQGVEITSEVRSPLLAYTGDTNPDGFDNNPVFFQAKILITEMSFVRPGHKRSKVHKFGHMHLDDFVDRADLFKNELVICGHASTRYLPDEIRKSVESKIPPTLAERLRLWL
ncbi:MAG: MBL fold metallo-hydrolase, partial [Planctomycetota bacterium]